MTRVVAASNRISVPGRSTSPGGVAASLQRSLRSQGGLWLGWDGTTSERAVQGGPSIAEEDGVSYVSITFDSTDYRDFYVGFCNSTLWPLLHSFVDRFTYNVRQFEAYQRMNQRYARVLAPLVTPDDVVWVHDYHLLPLARHLREAGCTQPVGLFVHTPFPQLEVLGLLPKYRDVLREMVAFDVVGFQTATDCEAFRSAVASIWGAQALVGDEVVIGHRGVITGVFPVGIDVDAIQAEAIRGLSSQACRRLIADTADRKLMLGVDRLDYSKGLVQRIHAYERFLATRPEHQGDISFVQLAQVSRTDAPGYAQLGWELQQAVARTNGRFAHTEWTPIRYSTRDLPHDAVMALMRFARVGLVTPLRDGMNLVAKEFVAAQDPADPGVLILSTHAGAARELTDAVLVDPHNLNGIAHAIQQAITMPLAERRRRHQGMLAALRRNSIRNWHSSFIDALESVRGVSERFEAHAIDRRHALSAD